MVCRHQQEHVTLPHNHGATNFDEIHYLPRRTWEFAGRHILTKSIISRVHLGVCASHVLGQQPSSRSHGASRHRAAAGASTLSKRHHLASLRIHLRAPPCTMIRSQFRQPRQRSHCIGTAVLLLHPLHVTMNNTRSSTQGVAARSRSGCVRDKFEASRLKSAKILSPCPQDEHVIIIHE